MSEGSAIVEHDKDKLGRFLTAVNSVTDKQVNEIIREAENERERIITAAVSAAETAKQRYLNDHNKMNSSKYVRMISKAELDMKKEVLLNRERLTAELFAKTKQMLSEYTATKEYAEQLCRNIASENVSDNARICISPEDMKHKSAIEAVCGKGAEIVEDDSIKYGGFYIIRQDKGTITDRTFDCALREQHSLFASKNLMASQGGQK